MEQLKVEGISKSFDGEPVLADISITLNKGELVSLLGISGGGKTTLFNIIAGLSRPDAGRVLLDGEDVTGCPGRVSYMLQKDLLLPYRTIEDNVSLPLVVKGMKKGKAREQAAPYFRQFGLEGTQKKYPAQLSGGMRQRAALLRTYLFSGSVALLDEPDVIRRKIKRAVTDSDGEIRYDPENKPGVSNLLSILSALGAGSMESLCQEMAGKGYGELKNRTADCVIAALEPLQREYKRIIADKAYLQNLINTNAEKAAYRANKTLRKVQKKIGFASRG